MVRTANRGGLGFGAQHSQAVENWALAIPGLKIAAPSTPADVIGLMAAAIRSDDPVVFFEHKGLFASKGPAAPEGHVVELGRAAVVREGSDVSLVALATVPLALAAAGRLAEGGISAEVVDLRCLVPLDMAAVLESVRRTSRLVIVEENPYQGGWGGTVASVVADEGFELLDAPVRRVAAACVPRPEGLGTRFRHSGQVEDRDVYRRIPALPVKDTPDELTGLTTKPLLRLWPAAG